MATALSCVQAAQRAIKQIGPLAGIPYSRAVHAARVKTCYRIVRLFSYTSPPILLHRIVRFPFFFSFLSSVRFPVLSCSAALALLSPRPHRRSRPLCPTMGPSIRQSSGSPCSSWMTFDISSSGTMMVRPSVPSHSIHLIHPSCSHAPAFSLPFTVPCFPFFLSSIFSSLQ